MVIQTIKLSKSFKGKLAVDNVNLNVEKGSIYGLIGKNGAGKTTLMKMIVGNLFPSDGTIKLFDSDNLDVGRRKIGSLIEEPGLYRNFSAYENIKRFSYLYGGTEEEIKYLLNYVGLGKVGNKKVKYFSLGMKQRLGIAIALLGNPEILVLDEPNNGLDPAGIKEIRETILKINKEKSVTVLISSHILDELAKIATKFGIINRGRLVDELTAEELAERSKEYLKLKVDDIDKTISLLKDKYSDIQFEVKKEYLLLYSNYSESDVIAKILINNDIKLYEMSVAKKGFENYFIERIK